MDRKKLFNWGLGFLVGLSGCGDFSFERFMPDRVKVGVMNPVGLSLKNLDGEGECIKRDVDVVARDYKPGTLQEEARRLSFWIPQTEVEYFSNEDGLKKSFSVRAGFNVYRASGKDHIYPLVLPRLSLRSHSEGFIGFAGIVGNIYPIWEERVKLNFGLGVDAHYYNIYSRTDVGIGALTLMSCGDRIEELGSTVLGRVGVESDLGLLPESWSFSLGWGHHLSLYKAEDAEGGRFVGYFVKELGKD